jgi:hypothetical protein
MRLLLRSHLRKPGEQPGFDAEVPASAVEIALTGSNTNCGRSPTMWRWCCAMATRRGSIAAPEADASDSLSSPRQFAGFATATSTGSARKASGKSRFKFSTFGKSLTTM